MPSRYEILIVLPNNKQLLGWILPVVWLTAGVLTVSNATAAEVFTRYKALEGSVVGGTAQGVEYLTIYGHGTIVIQWTDVDSIRSDKEFLILYGEDEEAVGRIWGLDNGDLMVGPDPVVRLGYRFVNREKLMISGHSGPGYMYQRYFGGDNENYFTIFFGGSLEATLPRGSKFKLTAEYLPKASDWQDT